MKKIAITTVLILFLSISVQAQFVFHDASEFLLMGKASDKTETLYERLPATLNGKTRKPVWNLGKNTAGLSIRFRTNAKKIGAKWTVINGTHMNHMTITNSQGLDLYALDEKTGVWTFVNSGLPKVGSKTHEYTIISGMSGDEREFMLNLPLYDGVSELKIGVDSLSTITRPKVELPSMKNPVVAYGTSILQGGCASRPGMAHTNILTRWLNREFINLGFSGNGQLDYEIAEVMADVDASLFLLDFVPNVSLEQIDQKMEKFYEIIRAKHPKTPMIFIEDPIFPVSKYSSYSHKDVTTKNAAMQTVYNKLRAKDSNIYFLSSKEMIGLDGEGTVDGIHFTDLGFMRYAEYLLPNIKLLLDEK